MVEWIPFIQQVGLPTAGVAWLAWYILIPVKDGHIKFLNETAETQKKLSSTIDKQNDIMVSVLSNQEKIVNTQEKMAEELEKVSNIVERLSCRGIKQ